MLSFPLDTIKGLLISTLSGPHQNFLFIFNLDIRISIFFIFGFILILLDDDQIFQSNSVVLAIQSETSSEVWGSGLEVYLLLDGVYCAQTLRNHKSSIFGVKQVFHMIDEKLYELGIRCHTCCWVTSKDKREILWPAITHYCTNSSCCWSFFFLFSEYF